MYQKSIKANFRYQLIEIARIFGNFPLNLCDDGRGQRLAVAQSLDCLRSDFPRCCFPSQLFSPLKLFTIFLSALYDVMTHETP